MVGTEGAFFFLLRARRGKFTPSLARLRLCVVEKAGAFFFLLRGRRGEIHSLTGASGGAFFFLFCARRGKFTHSLARPRLCVVFFVVCAAGEIHSLTRASGGAFFFLLCARRWTFTHSLARPGVIHSLTGACGGAFFFLLRARRGKFTHSLARPRLCVVGTEGAFFFLLRTRRGKFTPSLARLRLCVVEKAGAFFFLLRARQGEIHSLTGASGGAFFFCSVRGGGNSLTHWRVHGCVWFFFVVCAAGEIHSLTRASGGAFFLFAVCAAVDIHSLTGASRGDSLTHSRVRGRVFFLLRARWGKFTHSLACPRLCVVGTEGAFFFCSVRGGPSKKKNTGRVFFFVRHAAGRAKKKLFSRARRAKKKTHLPTLFRGYPEQYLHTLARTHHAPLEKQTLRRGLSFKGVGEPLPRTAGICVFDVHKMLRFSFAECENLLGSTCVLNSVYSVVVLSDRLLFSSFFPVEFATPAAVGL